MNKLNLLFFGLLISLGLQAQLVYKDVAGIFYKRCTSCHHTGASDFPFMNYTQTAAESSNIQAYLSANKMPPWNADTSYTRFLHERIITLSEKQSILNWISAGAAPGDTSLAPAPPLYTNGYQLAGEADLTLSIGHFTSGATSTDKYYCFSVPSGLSQDRIIRAFEIIPGNPAIVHHAVVTADTTGNYQSNLSGSCFNIPGNLTIGTYAPGTKATVFPSQAPLKAGMRLKAGSKVILQIHYPAGSSGQVDSTRIRFYFYPPGSTGIRPVYSAVPLQNWSMFIPANSTASFTAYYPSPSVGLPAPISIMAIMPHSHLICKSILNYALLPGVDTIKLIRINNWNFEWQDYYTYPKLVKIPSAYRLFAKHEFDNTSNNPNNPSNPPIAVSAGTGTHDEMLFDGILYLDYQNGDELIDLKSIIDSDPLLAVGMPKNEWQASPALLAVPNPFSETLKLNYTLPSACKVHISIRDLLGRVVYEADPGMQDKGNQLFIWNGTNSASEALPNGIYLLELRAGESILTGKTVKQAGN
ncbi:MAG TPA: FlgD immunoglobulin-like domain containing protein [Bacteroidia bacterium]|nr:FlgD immunoglobulin-like domain containing protein [Bacteroidia bacterium]